MIMHWPCHDRFEHVTQTVRLGQTKPTDAQTTPMILGKINAVSEVCCNFVATATVLAQQKLIG